MPKMRFSVIQNLDFFLLRFPLRQIVNLSENITIYTTLRLALQNSMIFSVQLIFRESLNKFKFNVGNNWDGEEGIFLYAQ